MTVEGIVMEALPGANFRVKLDDEREVLAYISGKMRVRRVRVLPGDKVKLELADPTDERGHIVWRL
jgi:translation initiation factor IF-1